MPLAFAAAAQLAKGNQLERVLCLCGGVCHLLAIDFTLPVQSYVEQIKISDSDHKNPLNSSPSCIKRTKTHKKLYQIPFGYKSEPLGKLLRYLHRDIRDA